MEQLLGATTKRAARYLAGLQERRVFPAEADLARLSLLGGPTPEEPADPLDVLVLLDDVGSPATVASAGPRYFGFVTGGALPATVAAAWLAAAWDQNGVMVVSSPVNAALEEIALAWLLDILGLPPGCGGGFVTGTTVGNLMALAAARDAVLAREGWDVEAQGLFGAPPITVVVGDEVHASLVKALGIVGLGRERVVRVPTDGLGRMRADALPALSGPSIVCLQAGNVNTGAFDPAREIIAQARAAGAWVHVDGAFGLWAAVAPARAHLADGVADADSWATDAHKWLNVPYDSGLVFTRDPYALRSPGAMGAAYLMQGQQREPSGV
jgi:glutamate/tyrosine decarboxylase-like PLP-dependent enzyme